MYRAEVLGVELVLESAPTLFSPSGVDKGTLAMLSLVELQEGELALDLGCGNGVVGLWLCKKLGNGRVGLCDIDPIAVQTAQANAVRNAVEPLFIRQSDALEAVERRDWTLILSNPPYHTDFSVAKRFIEQGFRHLAVGGRMMLVTKRLLWYKNKLTSVFGGVKVREVDGYYVCIAEKRPRKPRPV